MAEVTEAMEDSSLDTDGEADDLVEQPLTVDVGKDTPRQSNLDQEAETSDLTEQTLGVKGKKKTPGQTKDQENEKVKKILRKVKLVLEQSMERRRRGRKSTIIVFWYRRGKKNTNQENENEEDQSPTPSTSACVPGDRQLEESVPSPENALEN
ncbi:sperm protein associated with the nucleus on the X chromosome N3 [Suricata suricatta]|uniref:sperm protein associated with the nucleus on the X chromosome N3 n=1 Tax=Suricata suricatta TaxID=37032 RepID=UPI001155534E|nr:sperm protein associated with the nucleus on the X chromosome N3 [Suricata suricatta]